jgi:hypothetical protein
MDMTGLRERESTGLRLTTLDRMGAVFAGFAALALLSFPIIGRSFARMFQDFGSRERLPTLTLLAMSTWFPVSLGLIVTAMVLTGASGRLSLQVRRACIVMGFVIGGMGFALCVVGVYLPVFELAGAIKAE